MDGYIQDVITKYAYPLPKKPQLLPLKYRSIEYGANVQNALDEDSDPKIDENGIKRVQGIVGTLLYVSRAVNSKLLVALSAIGAQQAAATGITSKYIDQTLE